MIVSTTRVQRELSAVAVDLGEKAANDATSALRRLELAGASTAAEGLAGSIRFVRDRLKAVLPAEQGEVTLDVTPSAAKAYRVALITWVRVITKRAEADKAKGLTTDAHQLTKAAQHVLDQLHDQLTLPVVDITSFVDAKDEEGEPLADVLAIDDAPATSPAPHRGRRKPHPGAEANASSEDLARWAQRGGTP
jgi:hypothetical protein